jgi:ATP-dependent DNA helicase HFM1/MER3
MAICTAKNLANLWAGKSPRDRYWHTPRQKISLRDADLQSEMHHPISDQGPDSHLDCANSGVAYHHAGLDIMDRQAVEKSYLEGQISVVCCTSTLAVGVNLPCHLVIIKNTVTWTTTGPKDYADLEIMQMLGRAGR